MPCEGCQVQFTVFRRKRSCSDCRRFYCTNCLVTNKRNNGSSIVLCQRCAIFVKRPLLRSDLLHLKPKDLIFYLQSKHISTAGCVEKDELVCLVLNHAQQTDAHRENEQSIPEFNSRASTDTTNSFDSIKQTCQNFFTNISDNLTESFSNLDGRNNTKTQQHSQYNNDQSNSPTVEQPRVYTREIPTYASYQRRMASQTETPITITPTTVTSVTTTTATTTTTTSTSITPTIHSVNVSPASESTDLTKPTVANANTTNSSPTYSVNSVPSAIANNEVYLEDVSTSSTTATASKKQDNKSDCECSDDEIMADFSARQSLKTDTSHVNLQHTSSEVIGASISNTSTGYSKVGSLSSKVDICDASSQSSFEELGAIGGISDDSRPTTETNSSANMEQWLVLEVATTTITTPSNENMTEHTNANHKPNHENNTENGIVDTIGSTQQPRITNCQKPKVLRRRSDSYLNRRPVISPTSPTPKPNLSALSGFALNEQIDTFNLQEPTTSRRQRLSCTRCGKNKNNIRYQVEKMRRHLEGAQMSDEDIKREINEFLEYLEMRTKSIDQSDSETIGSLSAANLTQLATTSPTSAQQYDENAGIHVYATNSAFDGGDSRFINLEDFDNMDDLECLTVKQLKEILMLHRVDYKGCCEKQELLERVERIWKNLKSAPAVDKLPGDELCKICMDAPIECVILECGHMATCTSCGKVLSECPICRQYIVRVVRFFRA